MGTEGAEGYGGCAVDATDGPEWWRHFQLVDIVCVLCGGAVVGVGVRLRRDEVWRGGVAESAEVSLGGIGRGGLCEIWAVRLILMILTAGPLSNVQL